MITPYRTLGKYAMCLSLVFLAACSDDDDDKTVTPPFLGAWVVENVTCDVDGLDTTPWKGTRLTFTQTTETQGSFTYPDTADETVWKKSGDWTTATASSFVRSYDAVTVEHALTPNTLTLVLKTPLEVPYSCATGYCTMTVQAAWTFTVKKV